MEAQVSVPRDRLSRTPTRAPPRNSRGERPCRRSPARSIHRRYSRRAASTSRRSAPPISTLLATTALTIAAFVAARHLLVISPNRGSRDYGIYVSLTLATLLIAIVLENESLPAGSATLHYVIVPQLVAAARAAPRDLAAPGTVARRARRCRGGGDDRRRRGCSALGTEPARSGLLDRASAAHRAARFSSGARRSRRNARS